MDDPVIIRFGADSASVSGALRGMKGELSRFKAEAAGMFQEVATKIGGTVAFAVAVVKPAVEAASEFFGKLSAGGFAAQYRLEQYDKLYSKFIEKVRKENKERWKEEDERRQEQKKIEAIDAQTRDASRDRRRAAMTDEEKLADIMKEDSELTKEGLRVKIDSLRFAEIALEKERNLKEIIELRARIEKKKADDQKKAEEDRIKQLEKENQTIDDISKSVDDLNDKRDRVRQAREDFDSLSLQDLASMNTRGQSREARRQIFAARQVQGIDEQIRNARLNGWSQDAIDNLINRRTNITEGIEALSGKEKNPFKELEQASMKSEEHLKSLVDLATKQGLKIDIRVK